MLNKWTNNKLMKGKKARRSKCAYHRSNNLNIVAYTSSPKCWLSEIPGPHLDFLYLSPVSHKTIVLQWTSTVKLIFRHWKIFVDMLRNLVPVASWRLWWMAEEVTKTFFSFWHLSKTQYLSIFGDIARPHHNAVQHFQQGA